MRALSDVNASRNRQVPANAKCQMCFRNTLTYTICITYHTRQISLGQYTSVGTERRWARVIANGSSNTMMSLVSRRIEIFKGNAVLSTPKIKATKRLGLLDTATSASDVPQALPGWQHHGNLKVVESVFILFCVCVRLNANQASKSHRDSLEWQPPVINYKQYETMPIPHGPWLCSRINGAPAHGFPQLGHFKISL